MFKSRIGFLVIIFFGVGLTGCGTTNTNTASTTAHTTATPAPWHQGPHQIGTNF